LGFVSDSRRDRPSSPRRFGRPASPGPAGRPAPPPPEAGAGGKGRATPKRREAQQAKKRPLVPTDRRAANREARAKQREARARMNQAMLTGDERYLPARDRGPVRRYVRDYVDARWNLGEFFLPASLAIVVVVLLAGNRPQLAVVAILVIYVIVLAAMIDAMVLSRMLKRRVTAKFNELPKGTLMYGVMRAFQIRRTRLPRPRVKRGEYPH
jgi:hypothetical protein